MTALASSGLIARAPRPSALLTLLKPITWFAPMWAFGCGLVSSGRPITAHPLIAAAGVLLAGPLLCGTSQAVNDWFDRHVDAINEPDRPIPSGRVPGRWGLGLAISWSAVSMTVAIALGPWVSVAAGLGLALAWAYSAPPVRLKRDGWWGNLAVGVSYEGLPWFAGAAVLQSALPDPRIITAAALYSLGAHGIMTLNDFKSIEGDRQMGLASLPARYGAATACRIACVVMTLPQVIMVALLWHWGLGLYAAGVAALLAVQLALMARLLTSPRALAPWYNATGTSLYVFGMLAVAFALRP
ncbi:chlorophyll synthase ChlG [Lichenicoccus sp.]|uniref:chlorophyll synthase ChlG n=1 Tax=Lichenicoccus sp. TaxID=2781899 RepID=UPI003D13768D